MKKLTYLSLYPISGTLIFGALAVTPSPSAFAITGPSNYWECIISRLPSATTDQEATSMKRQCRWDFNDYYWRRALPKDEGFLGFSTKASECIEKEAAKTTSPIAKRLIREACIGNFPQ